jgi:putative transposase
MGRTIRTAAFKKKVVLETIREDKTLAQIASEHGVHPMLITKWKKELLDGMETLFGKKNKQNKEESQEREVLERKIGQLTIELDYLKKKLGY